MGGATRARQLLSKNMATCQQVSKASNSSPTVDQFTEALSRVPSWYTLGTFLGTPTTELDRISHEYGRAPDATLRCLIEVYKWMETADKSLSWDTIVTALKRMGNYYLAGKIYIDFIVSSSSLGSSEQASEPLPSTTSGDDDPVPVQSEELDASVIEYESLSNRFSRLVADVKKAFRCSKSVDVIWLQDLIKRKCDLPKLPCDKATIDTILDQVEDRCSILSYRTFVFLVEEVLPDQQKLVRRLKDFMKIVDDFKSSNNMKKLVTLIQSKHKQTTPTGDHKTVKLKVREFWEDFTISQFEIIVNKIFHNCNPHITTTHITVETGCICYSWIIPADIDTTELVPVLSLEFTRLIGLIHLHIGSNIIYNIEGDGCETIEAAMLQAIELKNTRAIELLLAVGCSPQVAIYNDSNTVTNIVNIRAIESKESSSDGSSGVCVDHVCILGHNEHVEAIIDPNRESVCSRSCNEKVKIDEVDQQRKQANAKVKGLQQEIDELRLSMKEKSYDEHVEAIIDFSRKPECSSCNTKEEMNKKLYQEVDEQKQRAKQWIAKIEELQQEIDELILTKKEEEHGEAIIDPSREPECSSCSVKKKMIKQLHVENSSLRNDTTIQVKKNQELASEIELLKTRELELVEKMKLKVIENEFLETKKLEVAEEMKIKDAEIMLLKGTNENLIEEAVLKDDENLSLKENDKRLIKVSLSRSFPTVDQFIEALSEVPSWYGLGISLGVPTTELDKISHEYGRAPDATLRCLTEVYKWMETADKSLSWDTIVTALRKMGKHSLVEKIYTYYILRREELIQTRILDDIFIEYASLSERFTLLVADIRKAFRCSESNIDVEMLQVIIKRQCGLPKLPPETATIDAILDRVEDHCSILNNHHIFIFLIENILPDQQELVYRLYDFRYMVHEFKLSMNIQKLAILIESKQITPTGDHKTVKVMTRGFQSDFMKKEFEMVVNEILQTLFDITTHVTVY